MGLLFFYLFLALVVSFLCSIMESVLLSAPQSFVLVEKGQGKAWATKMAFYKLNVDKPLSAILSLNTVAHTIGAAGVGAQAVRVFGEIYFGVVSVVLTLLILIFTEIIPKTIGANNWRALAAFTTQTIQIMIIIAYPLVWLTSLISKLATRRENRLSISREEISVLAGIGAEEGIFSKKVSKIIQNVLRLRDVRVKEVMTPRVVVARAEENTLLMDFMKEKDFLKFSRIPVYESTDDHITGYVFRQSVFEELAEDHHELKLKDLKRDILVVNDSMTLLAVWDLLLQKREHMALVVDEYGGMDGIVTMEDIIESLLGLEIVDEMDTVVDMQQLAKERWEARQAKYKWIQKTDKP